MINTVRHHFESLFERALLDEIIAIANYEELSAGTVLMDVGQYIKTMPLLLSGRIKVSRIDEDGNELLLYYLTPGQTCSVSLNCAIGRVKSEIRALAEEDSEILAIPITKMEDWMATYKSWRQYVLNAYQQRFDELLESIDSIAFQNMDERLLSYLQQRANANHQIETTHQDIAKDLNTSRVVISRLLKKLERNGVVQLGRNKIEIKAM